MRSLAALLFILTAGTPALACYTAYVSWEPIGFDPTAKVIVVSHDVTFTCASCVFGTTRKDEVLFALGTGQQTDVTLHFDDGQHAFPDREGEDAPARQPTSAERRRCATISVSHGDATAVDGPDDDEIERCEQWERAKRREAYREQIDTTARTRAAAKRHPLEAAPAHLDIDGDRAVLVFDGVKGAPRVDVALPCPRESRGLARSRGRCDDVRAYLVGGAPFAIVLLGPAVASVDDHDRGEGQRPATVLVVNLQTGAVSRLRQPEQRL